MPQPTLAEQERLDLIERLGKTHLDGELHSEGREYVTSDPFTPIPKPPMSRHDLLAQLHKLLAPRTYFEIGVSSGASLALSKTTTIAVDPYPVIDRAITCDFELCEETSDAFFARPGAFDHFDGAPFDLSFIDGMHLSEFALRDFMNAEKHAAPSTVIVFDDVLPRNALEAYRTRRTTSWAGDVYKVYAALRKYRRDLVLLLLNTSPTGTLLVANLDPSSTVLDENLAEIEKALTTPDPQEVPEELLTRSIAVDPRDVLAWDGWARVVELRSEGAPRATYAELFAELARMPRLGSAAAELAAELAVARERAAAELAAANKRADAVRSDLVGLLERLNRSPAGIVLRRVDRWKVLCRRYGVA